MKLLNLPHIKRFAQIFATEIENFRIVGGAIRDELLNLPVQDIDIAAKFEVTQLIKLCIEKKLKYKPTGIKYGTITVYIAKQPIEITSLRKDLNTDGRHCEVEFTEDFLADAKRRDFTINALYLDFAGNLYDYFQGRDHIKQKKLVFIGDIKARINEDYLRILRLFRFQAKLQQFKIDKHTLSICAKFRDKLKQISAERMREEMMKLLAGPNYITSLELMSQYKICDFCLDYQNIAKLKKFAAQHYMQNIAIILLHQITLAQSVKQLTNALKLSKKQQQIITMLKSEVIDFSSLATESLHKIIFTYGQAAAQNLYINYVINNEVKLDLEILHYMTQVTLPKFPLTGSDLKKLGYQEGTELGHKLTQLKEKWIESDFKLAKHDLIALAKF